jgi:hypothetical protein
MSQEKAVKKSVSLPEDLALKAVERSKQEHRSFSSYIQMLIARDAHRPLQEQHSQPA